MADPSPTPRELEALKVLWTRGRATVREIYDEMHPGETRLAYTTVLSLLQTMELKGLVGHESAGKAYAYFAAVPRDAVFRQLAVASWSRSSTGRWGSTWQEPSSPGRRASPNSKSWKR